MKSKSSLKDKKIDFLKWLKPSLIVSLILVVIASIFWGVFGFNKGFDFTGGTQLVVDFSAQNNLQTDEGVAEVSKGIREILNENDVEINSFQLQGEYYEKCFVITFKETDIDTVRNIRLQINAKYNQAEEYLDLAVDQKEKVLDDEAYYSVDMTRGTTEIDSLISPTAVITTISTVVFALIIAMIYACFRFKTAGALTIVFAGVFATVLTAAFVLITRIEINTYFFAVLGLVLIASVYGSADFLFNVKQKTKDPMLTDKTNHDLANIVLNENLVKNIVVYSSILVASLLLGIVAVLNILHLSLAVVVGLAVTFASNLFVVPAFWATINKKRELSRPTAILNNKDDSAEVVEVEEETNDNDENQEVVEVND